MDVDDGSEQTVPKQAFTVPRSSQRLNSREYPSLTLSRVEVDPPTTATKAIEGFVDARVRADGQKRSDDSDETSVKRPM